MNVAVIPARGGSKRIPMKNIKDFCGKPMILYAIEEAKNSKLFDEIIVSTDSEEIAKFAKLNDCLVPFKRPKKLSDDFTPTDAVMKHAVSWLQKNSYELFSVCCIYATAPFINKDDLINAFKIFKTQKWSYVFSATSFSFPIQRGVKKLPNGGIEMFQPENFYKRSQDLEEGFHDAGQFYFGKPNAWLNKEKLFTPKSEIVILPRWKVQDIDNKEDWLNAEIIMKIISKKKGLND